MKARALTERLDDFFFPIGSAWNLGVCRFLFFSTLLFVFNLHVPGVFAGSKWQYYDLPEQLWIPVSFLSVFSKPFMTGDVAKLLETVLFVALLASALGICTRISTSISALLLMISGCAIFCYGELAHEDALVALAALTFAGSRCGDAFSLDGWIKAWWDQRVPLRSFERAYGWPIQLIRAELASVMLCAAIAKLRWSGFEWITSDTLRNYLLRAHYRGYLSPFWHALGIGPFLAEHKELCHVIAGLAVSVEFLAPLILWPRFRWFTLPIFLTQFGFHALITPSFIGFFAVYLCLMPWARLREFAVSWRAHASPAPLGIAGGD